MALCPRCRHQFRTLPGETGDHPCTRCGLSPWDVILNGEARMLLHERSELYVHTAAACDELRAKLAAAEAEVTGLCKSCEEIRSQRDNAKQRLATAEAAELDRCHQLMTYQHELGEAHQRLAAAEAELSDDRNEHHDAVADLVTQRDEAREAARWLLRWWHLERKRKEAVQRWPWLKEVRK